MLDTVTLRRIRIRIGGAVQGVGFRPFVFRLARELGVAGWIVNDPTGVIIEAEAAEDVIARFRDRVRADAPPRAAIHSLQVDILDAEYSAGFRILESVAGGARTAVVLPDVATCADCRAEIVDARDRRHRYAFTNCTNCGPRYSIVRALPYDRANTTMAGFAMCDRCRGEYRHPLDRRFHAQPNACPVCGPRLAICDASGVPLECADPVATAAGALRAGAILAVKGIGGYQLMCDAACGAAVARLRGRKNRRTKPFAIMAATLDQARCIVHIDEVAAALLSAPEAPIVLLPRRRTPPLRASIIDIAEGVAPCNPHLGVMLPATPLHHLLMREFAAPVVATSGNRSEEPICIGEEEAFERLAGIADMFLVHDRPIERHVDDSVAMVVDGAPVLLRRARGYAPMPVLLHEPIAEVMAVGPHLKNTIALSKGQQVFISQHIGDLETAEAQAAFARTTADFIRLYEAAPTAVAHDMHPDYASTRFATELAERLGVPAIPVQHHHAHLAACMAENGVAERTLGIVWDGTGYGTDGTIWGGEVLLGDAHSFERAAHLLPFRLPGGEAAVREPRRVALALLHAVGGVDAVTRHEALRAGFSDAQLSILAHMAGSGLNAPVTSSAGRLLDGIAALLGICSIATFEGEAAIRLEHRADPSEHGTYEVPLLDAADAPLVLDWRPMISALLEDQRRGVPVERIAARVHNGMAAVAATAAEIAACERVALSGGCFQNRMLLQRTAARLRHRGFRVLQHGQVPANDGGVSLGQVIVAAARLRSL